MKKTCKCVFIVTISVLSLIIAYVIYQTIMKDTIAKSFSHVQYAALENEDSLEKKEISASVNKEISEKIKELAVIKVFGRKSVSFGKLLLFDKEGKLVARIGILEYPLFTFNGTQLELHYDLVGAYGFSLQGYEVSK